MRWLNNSAKRYQFGGGPSFGAHGITALDQASLQALGRNPLWCQLVERGDMVCLDPAPGAGPVKAYIPRPEPPEAALGPHPDVVEWGELNAPSAIRVVQACDDLTLLAFYAAQEESRPRPRKSVMAALAAASERVG